MSLTSKAALALGFAAIVIGAGCSARPVEPAPPYMLQPVDGAGAPLEAETPVVVEHPGVRVVVQSLSMRGRELWLRQNTGLDLDPLSKAPEGSRFLTVRLRLDANGDQPVHVESGSIRLWHSGGQANSPALDYPRAYELLRPDIESAGPDAADVERFMRGLFDGAVDLPPGAAKEGILVYPEPPLPKEGGFVLEIPFLQVGSKTYRVKVPFTALALQAPPAPAQ